MEKGWRVDVNIPSKRLASGPGDMVDALRWVAGPVEEQGALYCAPGRFRPKRTGP